ncbi:MAG: TIGR01620 family protein, partial [Hyphomicrobiaceae bacterium]|nr:TIGR01620 family protein [Hyphomicrobiaceae bacterium]
PRRRLPLLGAFLSGLGGLVLLALGLWAEGLISALFSRYDALGYIALGLAGLALLGLFGLLVREWRSLSRLSAITELRRNAEKALGEPSTERTSHVLARLDALYADRADTAKGRAAITARRTEVMDAEDRLTLAERDLMAPLDARVKAEISASARRISLITAVSPRALVDVAAVAFEAIRLSGRIARIYGARPGTLGSLRMLRTVIAHLAVTGGMAAADDLVGQVLGHGLAARLSARLGEGLVNGLMTARVGIAAMDALRPLPFAALSRPSLTEVTKGMASLAAKEPEAAS